MAHYEASELVYQAIDRETEQSDLAAWQARDELTEWLETQCPETAETESEQ